MKNKLSASLILPAILVAGCQTEKNQLPSKPNIILIQADDLGYVDLAMHGNKIVESPNLDAFASKSLQFNQYYVNPVCSASRASLLTGRHFLKTGVAHVHGGKDYVALDETTIAEVLKSAGYVTGMWGKWHTGKTAGYFPWERGFDEAYMAQLYKHENSCGKLNGVEVSHEKWADDVIASYAIDFIERNKDTSFFAYLPLLSIHSPLRAPEHFIKKYTAKGISKNLATIYAMVEHLDSHLKRVFDKVEELGLSDNTIILFMSDNGPAVLNNLLSDEDRDIRYVNGFKGHKGNIWENGVKSPLFIYWGKHLKSGFRNQLVDVTDVFPTIAQLAGADITGLNHTIDGSSFVPLLTNNPENWDSKRSFNYANIGWPPSKLPWTPEGVHNEYRPVFPNEKSGLDYSSEIISVRNQQYKLLLNPGKSKGTVDLINGKVLIDILNDSLENHNLAEEKPEVAKQLENELKQWFEDVLAEKNSFSMPVFLIGKDGQKESIVYANGAKIISEELKNTTGNLKNWKNTGDFAEYSIDVRTSGKYEMSLQYKNKDEKANSEFHISVGEERVIISLGEQNNMGFVSLKQGVTTLRLELVKCDVLPEFIVGVIMNRVD